MLGNGTNSFDSSLDMEAQFLEIDMDPSALVCVNPYEVNPVIMERHTMSSALDADVLLKGDSSGTPQPHWDTSYGAEFYRPPGKIKLEMEVFKDLSKYVPQRPMSTSSVDELQTPTFDKDAFQFIPNVNPKDSQSGDIFVKLESDAIYRNTCIITDNSQFKDLNIRAGKVHPDENINSGILGNFFLQNSDLNIFMPTSENGSTYSCKTSPTPTFENTHTAVYNVDDNSALSVSRQFSHGSSNERFQQFNSGLETPEDSNSNISHESVKRPSHLALDVNLRSTESILATPSIIEEVVDLEEENFNILDLVRSEEITFVNAEDIFPPPSVAYPASSDVKILSQKHEIPQKRPRKRRIYADDDEDYVPPTKKNVTQHRRAQIKDSDSEFDSDAEIEFKPKARPRGRPPKRTESVSSDCSKDSDASKYRELRDKNNEASRKSRLKRKIKELELEKEVEELERRNIKLKSEEAFLEKMVATFTERLLDTMKK